MTKIENPFSEKELHTIKCGISYIVEGIEWYYDQKLDDDSDLDEEGLIYHREKIETLKRILDFFKNLLPIAKNKKVKQVFFYPDQQFMYVNAEYISNGIDRVREYLKDDWCYLSNKEKRKFSLVCDLLLIFDRKFHS